MIMIKPNVNKKLKTLRETLTLFQFYKLFYLNKYMSYENK